MTARRTSSHVLALALAAGLGCSATPTEPQTPTWADVAPIFRGECNSCHGWTAGQTGAGYRFDFFDVSACGEAALAIGQGVILAGSPVAAPQIEMDLVPQGSAAWPRMPPEPSPALPDWEVGALQRWAAQAIAGPAPPGNRPPTLSVEGYPTTAGAELAFTAILQDPDDDSAIGVIEVNGYAFLMNRTGSFAVRFDSSSWPPGPQPVKAVLCDGWVASTTPNLGTVQVKH
jgi:hypothetical protein